MLVLSHTLKPAYTLKVGTSLPRKKSIKEFNRSKISNIDVSVLRKKENILEKTISHGGTKITPTCLKQQEINEIVTKNHSGLLEYTEKAIYALKRNIDSTTLLSEGYLHLQSYASELKNEAQVISYYKNFIKMNLTWTNSPVIRNERAILIDFSKRSQEEYHQPPEECEEWIKSWESTLKNEEARLWNIWYHRNLRKGREIAEHLDISISGSYSLIKECKLLEQDLRNYILKKLV